MARFVTGLRKALNAIFGTEGDATEGRFQVNAAIENAKDITEIAVGTAGELVAEYSPQFDFNIEASDRVKDRLVFRQVNGRAQVYLRPTFFNWPWEIPSFTVHLKTPVLDKVNLSGATRGRINGFHGAEKMRVELSGASSCEAETESNRLEVRLSGASFLNINGKASLLDVHISGASRLDGNGYEAVDGKFDISGASFAAVGVTGKLNADLSGASTLINRKQCGSCSIDRSGASTFKNGH